MIAPACYRSCPPIISGNRLLSSHAGGGAVTYDAEELAEFRESVRGFAQEVIAPHAAEIDANNSFPTSVNLWKAMGDMGLHGEL